MRRDVDPDPAMLIAEEIGNVAQALRWLAAAFWFWIALFLLVVGFLTGAFAEALRRLR